MSSLFVRKTRKSIGEQNESSTETINFRSPSTPLPPSQQNHFATPPPEPPSGPSRSSSRLSWTQLEEERGLGLAGPNSKPKVISERDEEWVESMKEKVRLASAEKEKREKDGKGRKSFGEMEKVGGTKRLFRKK